MMPMLHTEEAREQESETADAPLTAAPLLCGCRTAWPRPSCRCCCCCVCLEVAQGAGAHAAALCGALAAATAAQALASSVRVSGAAGGAGGCPVAGGQPSAGEVLVHCLQPLLNDAGLLVCELAQELPDACGSRQSSR